MGIARYRSRLTARRPPSSGCDGLLVEIQPEPQFPLGHRQFLSGPLASVHRVHTGNAAHLTVERPGREPWSQVELIDGSAFPGPL